MNLVHHKLCNSDRWRRAVETHILPWALEGVDLGSNVLEVGPGPGITTDFLRTRVEKLTCVEIDRGYAESLGRRMAGKVAVLCEDATCMSLKDATFDGAVCLTMLHHVASAALQDRLFGEVARVLRPGGALVGVDSVNSFFFRLLHLFDTMVPVDPGTLSARLKTAGFTDIQVDVNPYAFRFHARRP